MLQQNQTNKMSVCTSALTQLLQDIPASAIQKASKASSLEKCFSLSWIVMVMTVRLSLLRYFTETCSFYKSLYDI